MFRSLSFPFSRIFRLRRRRAAKPSPSSVARASCSAPPPPSKSRRPVSSPPKPINTTPIPSTRRRTLFVSSLLSPVAQSPLAASPGVTPPPPGTPPPVLIIGRALPQSTLPLPPAASLPGPVGPQIPVDGVSLLESPPAPNTRRVSFQLPTTDTLDRPESPLSTCSTLVTEVGGHTETELASAIPPEQPPEPETGFVGDAGADADAELVAELPSVARSGSGRARHRSLFNPQPVRVDLSRFSLPIAPATPSNSRNVSKRSSVERPASSSGSTKKEKRTSRWSRELDKPETQEVLRALAYRAF